MLEFVSALNARLRSRQSEHYKAKSWKISTSRQSFGGAATKAEIPGAEEDMESFMPLENFIIPSLAADFILLRRYLVT
jgi:hypothetical protein